MANNLYPAPAEAWSEIGFFDGTHLYQSGAVIAWTGDLVLDDDGDPQAYHPEDWGPLHGRAPRGHDRPENALTLRSDLQHPPADYRLVKKWAGVAVGPDGHPVVQGPSDPAPGYWVSTTALADSRYGSGDPRRYVDASTVPYISIPPVLQQHGVRLGDVAAVEYGDKACFAQVADIGPPGKIGEGSPALARSLGLPDDPRGGGTRQGVRTYVFCGSGSKKPLPVDEINQLAQPLYDRLRRAS